jgi:hypothetical protein
MVAMMIPVEGSPTMRTFDAARGAEEPMELGV